MRKVAASLLVLITLTASCTVFANAVPYSTRSRWNTWGSKASMPTKRVSVGAAAVKGKIYVMGGNGDYHNTNEMYDPTTDTWTTKAPMPTPRKSFGIAVYQDKIYVMGGLTDSDGSYYAGITGVNEVYDPATGMWENKTSMPTRRIGINANVVEDKIYVIGGYNGSVYGDLTQIYDPETDTWSNGAPIPFPAIGMGAGATTGVWAPKRIYVIGAIQPYGIADRAGTVIIFNNVQNQIYDPEKDAWSTGAALPIARILFGVAVVDDVLYAIGGTNSGLFSSYVTFGDNQQYTPYGYGTIPPVISVVSPENKNYTSGNVSLTFAVNKPALWMGYSLDRQDNVTITGNTTLSGLSSGLHNVTVYAKDTFENTGASETITFHIPEPFPTMLVAVAAVAVAVGSVGVLVYFRKRKH